MVPYSGKLLREKIYADYVKIQFSLRKLLRIATKPQNSQKFSPLKVSRYTVYHLNAFSPSFHAVCKQCWPKMITAYTCCVIWLVTHNSIALSPLSHLQTHLAYPESLTHGWSWTLWYFPAYYNVEQLALIDLGAAMTCTSRTTPGCSKCFKYLSRSSIICHTALVLQSNGYHVPETVRCIGVSSHLTISLVMYMYARTLY